MRSFLFSLIATASLLLGSAAFAATDIKTLAGYNTINLATGFTEFLQDNPDVVKKLAADEKLSKQVFASMAMQRKLMAEHETTNSGGSVNHTTTTNTNTTASTNENISNEAAELIKKATANYEAAQNDPDLAAELADEANEGKNQQTATPASENDAALAANEPYAVTNVNAIPSAEDLALDANGWPRYLRAPADCASPMPGLTYSHEARLFSDRLGELPAQAGKLPAAEKNNIISPYFDRAQSARHNRINRTFRLFMKHDEVFSVPFIFKPENENAYTQWTGFYKDEQKVTVPVVSISDCPGDFGTDQPTINQTRLEGRCVIENPDAATGSSLYFGHAPQHSLQSVCSLTPGKRYFINIQPIAGTTRIDHDDDSHTWCYHQTGYPSTCHIGGKNVVQVPGQTKRQTAPAEARPNVPSACLNGRCDVGAVIINLTAGRHSAHHALPYNGPCLQQGPYPINYSSSTCGRSFGDTLCAKTGDAVLECHDPQGELPSVRLAKSCMAGQRPIWLEGYGVPIHSRLRCESDVDFDWLFHLLENNITNTPNFE